MSGGVLPEQLVVEADGGSRGNPGPAGYGAAVLIDGAVVAERAEFIGTATNNVAEYRGLIAGLEAAAQINPDALVAVRMDSKLVVEQMSGNWKIKHPDMRELAYRAREIFPAGRVVFEWIPRDKNAVADALANEAMDGGPGTVIARDFLVTQDDVTASEELTWLALTSPGDAAVETLQALGSKLIHVPAPTWVLAADDDDAKQTARVIASRLQIPPDRRKLEADLGAGANREPAISAALSLDSGGCVIAVAHASVIEAEVSRALGLDESAKALINIVPGSVTVLGYRGGAVKEILSVGAFT